MVACGIGILPLMKHLKTEYPIFTQTWYNDNDGALGVFTNVQLYFNDLKQHGAGQGIALIMHLDNALG